MTLVAPAFISIFLVILVVSPFKLPVNSKFQRSKDSCNHYNSETYLLKQYYKNTAQIHMDVDAAMKSEYDALAKHLLNIMQYKKPLGQHWVGIAGGPGSGKSTLAAAVANRVNSEAKDKCVVLPMDGFHYSRRSLKDMGDSGPLSFEELISRRGAPWTFDASSLVTKLTEARMSGEASLPIYSRQLSDPVPDGVQLTKYHQLVLVEGNYLLNWDDPLWAGLRYVFDERWFISCANAVDQRERLVRRHLETWTEDKTRMWGPGQVGAAKKADSNDVLNALFVENHKKYADRIIVSR